MKSSLSVGNRIALARDKYGLTQVELSESVGVTRAAISQYEKDMTRPRRAVVARLAELFDADPEWFDEGRGRGPGDPPVTVPAVNVSRLTLQTDLRDLEARLQWRFPAGAVPNATLAIVAPNDAGPVQSGDRVFIDTHRRRRSRDAVFLIVDDAGARLHVGGGGAAKVIGRVVAYLRVL